MIERIDSRVSDGVEDKTPPQDIQDLARRAKGCMLVRLVVAPIDGRPDWPRVIALAGIGLGEEVGSVVDVPRYVIATSDNITVESPLGNPLAPLRVRQTNSVGIEVSQAVDWSDLDNDARDELFKELCMGEERTDITIAGRDVDLLRHYTFGSFRPASRYIREAIDAVDLHGVNLAHAAAEESS